MTRRLIYRNDRKTFQERGIDGEKVTEYISENKDVDGLTTITAGKLSRGETDIFVPCTPGVTGPNKKRKASGPDTNR